MRYIASKPFNVFDRSSLEDIEKKTLDGGIVKHTKILVAMTRCVPAQTAFAYTVDDVFTLLTAVSFITVLLGTAWYAISFQNVSEKQLEAGVADYITLFMFRAFMTCLSALAICLAAYFGRATVPELFVYSMDELHIGVRLAIFLSNLFWVFQTVADIWRASVAYDAADSLLGDGFPTLMRGARANAKNERLAEQIEELIEALRENKKGAQ